MVKIATLFVWKKCFYLHIVEETTIFYVITVKESQLPGASGPVVLSIEVFWMSEGVGRKGDGNG